MAGTNDLIQSVSLPLVQSNMACAVHHCHHFGITPYLGIPILSDPASAIQHWGDHIDFETVNRQLEEYRLWLYQFSKQFSCQVIDFQKHFQECAFVDPEQGWYLDGLHPTAKGNEILAESLPKTLYK